MRTLSLVIKEIKQLVRDRNGMIFTIVFPIVLTLVLGASLSNMFSSNSGPTRIDAYYHIEGNSPMAAAFKKDFVPQIEKEKLYLKEETPEKALNAVKFGDSACYIEVGDDRIVITMRDGGTMSGQIAETMVKAYASKFNTIMTVAKVNPLSLKDLNSQDESTGSKYTESVSLQKQKAPRALDYYALTMLTLIIMYAGPAGSSLISDERQQRTLSRMVLSPVKNAEILVSKVTGMTLVTCLQVVIVFFFDKFVLKTEWGTNIPAVAAILLAQIIMVVSVGVGMAYLFKENSTGTTILNTLIPILIFLGGGYVNLELMGIGGIISQIAWLSPVKWLNQTLLQVIYANDYSTFGTTIALYLGIAIVFLAISSVLSKKEVYA
ncbi:MAG: ABC transporter permease [Clostridia bacterium]|nr:ABC transporter permease [Clostridia bacterium]